MRTKEKIIALEKVAAEIRAYKGLEIAKNATNAVPGEGNPDAKIMFIGEAPGRTEDETGRPFVGQGGKLLEKNINSALHLNRLDVYITNIVKYRPPDNRDPTEEEIKTCRPWLNEQIQIIKPQFIVTLGRFSMAKFAPEVTISKVHGQTKQIPYNDHTYTIFFMYHPAAALRSTAMMTSFVKDFETLAALVK